MMHADDAARRRRCAIRFVVACGATIALVACAGEDRPAVDDWNGRWGDARRLVPTERALADGGHTFCDDLTTRLRTELDDLTPAPSEAVDRTVDAWRDQLRTLAFECPSDPDVVAETLATIHTLEAEIAAAGP